MKHFFCRICLAWCVVMVITLVVPLQSFQLKEQFAQGLPGQYVVALYQKHYILIRILAKEQQVVTVEELLVPAMRRPQGLSWQQWMAQGAPCATSHSLYRIDLTHGRLLSQEEKLCSEMTPWVQSFLTSLLNMPLEDVPVGNRRKIARTQLEWVPKLSVCGHPVQVSGFRVLWGIWPADQSVLAGRRVELYVPLPGEGYPSFFPTWIQVQGIDRGTISLVDGGA